MIFANPPARLQTLRLALLANALFSLSTGTGLVLFADSLAALTGPTVPAAILIIIGLGLLPFGAFVLWLGTRRQPEPMIALTVSLADLSWVGGSAALLTFASDQLSVAGVGLVIVVALCVLSFALGQIYGIARAYASDADPSRFRVCFDVRTDGSAATIWRNLSDLGGIVRFAPSLVSSRLRENQPAAPGAVRDCTDRSGRRWAERCMTLDHERRELVMEFLTREPGFPFPFVVMTGGWSVHPETAGTLVRVWWEGSPKYSWLNGVLLPLLAWQARRQFPTMVRLLAGHTGPTAAKSARLTLAPC